MTSYNNSTPFVNYKTLESSFSNEDEVITEGMIATFKKKRENNKKINALWVDLNTKKCSEIAKLFVENFNEPKFKSKLISGKEGKDIIDKELQYFKEDGDLSVNKYAFVNVNGIIVGIMPRDINNLIGCEMIIAAIDCIDRHRQHRQANIYYKDEICKMILHIN